MSRAVAGANSGGTSGLVFARVLWEKRRMTPRLLLPLLLALTSALFHPSALAAPARMTVADYFVRLPQKDYFEVKPSELLTFLQQPKCGVLDPANGYLSCTGDGAQPSFAIALFRYRDGRPLLALCMGELEGPDSVALDFFEPAASGAMRKIVRSIFPIADGKNRRFEIPRHGRTILVRDGKSGKVLHRLTWDGEKFAEEK